eukprot:1113324-Amphidinium_carterae.3
MGSVSLCRPAWQIKVAAQVIHCSSNCQHWEFVQVAAAHGVGDPHHVRCVRTVDAALSSLCGLCVCLPRRNRCGNSVAPIKSGSINLRGVVTAWRAPGCVPVM